MARWSLLVADTDGTVRGEWVKARGLSVTFALAAPSTAKWKSPGDDPAAMIAHETASDALLYRDDTLMFRGRLGSTGDEGDEDRHDTDWSAISYRGLLERRKIRAQILTLFEDQAAIAWGVINEIQAHGSNAALYPEGDMGITDASTPTGKLRSRAYEWGKPVGEAIQQLSEVIDGFDWDITPDLEFKTWYPQRGQVRPWAAVFRDTVKRWSRQVDTSDFATDVLASGGEDSGGNQLRSVASVVGPRGPGGRWEKAMSWSDVTRQNTLNEHADAAVADLSVIRPTYEVTLKPGAWTPDDAWLGDTTRLVIQSGRVQVDTSNRILAAKIDVDDNGEETVALTYGRRATDFRDRVMSMDDQIATLSRR